MSQHLELDYEWGWGAGDPRISPSGRALGGTRRESYWVGSIKSDEEDSIAGVIESFLRDLKAKRSFLRDFTDSEGTVELFVGCFEPPGEVFHWTLLKRLAALRISLSWDVSNASVRDCANNAADSQPTS